MVMSEVAIYCLKQRSQLNIAQFRLQRTHQRLERKPRVLNINQAIPKCLIESAGVLAQGEDVIVRAEFDDGTFLSSWNRALLECAESRASSGIDRKNEKGASPRKLVERIQARGMGVAGKERLGQGGNRERVVTSAHSFRSWRT